MSDFNIPYIIDSMSTEQLDELQLALNKKKELQNSEYTYDFHSLYEAYLLIMDSARKEFLIDINLNMETMKNNKKI